MLSPHPEKWGDASPRPPPIDARAVITSVFRRRDSQLARAARSYDGGHGFSCVGLCSLRHLVVVMTRLFQVGPGTCRATASGCRGSWRLLSDEAGL